MFYILFLKDITALKTSKRSPIISKTNFVCSTAGIGTIWYLDSPLHCGRVVEWPIIYIISICPGSTYLTDLKHVLNSDG